MRGGEEKGRGGEGREEEGRRGEGEGRRGEERRGEGEGRGGQERGKEGRKGKGRGIGKRKRKDKGREEIITQLVTEQKSQSDVHTLKGSSGLLPSSNSAVIGRGSVSNGFRNEKR